MLWRSAKHTGLVSGEVIPLLHNSRSRRRTTKRFPCSGFSKTLISTCGRLSLRPSPIWTALLASMWVPLANHTLDNSHNPIPTTEQMMNEPHRGYIDLPSLHKFDYNTDLHLSYVRTCSQRHPTRPITHPFPASAFQSFMLASGYPTEVGYWTRSFPIPTRRTAYNVLNPMGRKAWRKDGPTDGKCVWEMHGVWGYDGSKSEGVVLRENYFVKHPATEKKVNASPPRSFINSLKSIRSIGIPTSTSLSFVSGQRGCLGTPQMENTSFCFWNQFRMRWQFNWLYFDPY